MDSIARISHNNWLAAQEIAHTWCVIDQNDQMLLEAIETSPLHPNRRAPRPIKPATHPSRDVAEQHIPQTSGRPVEGHQPGYIWTVIPLEGMQLVIDADSRESAIVGYQTLSLLLQDPEFRQDMVVNQVSYFRFRRRLTRPDGVQQLGYSNSDGVSLEVDQPIPYIAAVAAHQMGHIKHGNSDDAADRYTLDYRARNQERFTQWRQAAGSTSAEPTVEESLAILKRQAPAVYQSMRDYALTANPQTGDSEPVHILTQVAFVDLQRQTERRLKKGGVNVSLPKEMPNCVSPKAIGVRPMPPTGGAVQSPPSLPSSALSSSQLNPGNRPADQLWEVEPSLPQQSRITNTRTLRYAKLDHLREGGLCVYRGVVIIGTRANCEAIQRALDECWADPEFREVVWGFVQQIYANRFQDVYGVSVGSGIIAVDPSDRDVNGTPRSVIDKAGTLGHEGLHEKGYGERDHPWIYQKQREFVARRQASGAVRAVRAPVPVAA